ncbi:MAG: hypothetical protein M3305_02370 [Actinomycetota bacterium]|nr:hypothetical protein [Actinomycetota bacterium]
MRVRGIVKRLLPALNLFVLVDILPAGGGARLPARQQNDGGAPEEQQPFSVTPTYEYVAYATASDTQKLAIYLPSGHGSFPTVILAASSRPGRGFLKAFSTVSLQVLDSGRVAC